MQKPLDQRIHSVPALLLLNTKEYLFGKAVFDYLLLPNRGILFSSNSTRNEKRIAREPDNTTGADGMPLPPATPLEPSEPMAFTLGAISAEHFSNIDDSDGTMNDKNYNWDVIGGDDGGMGAMQPTLGITGSSGLTDSSGESDGKKKLPTMEEIMKQRSMDIM